LYGCWQPRISTNKRTIINEVHLFLIPHFCFFSGSSFNVIVGANTPPKTPARSKTPLRGAKKLTPDKNPDEQTPTGPARKQKAGGIGGGGGGIAVSPPGETKTEVAMTEAPKPANITSSGSKEAKKTEAPESVENPLMPSVKAVPPSPKVYIRKVKGKAKKQ